MKTIKNWNDFLNEHSEDYPKTGGKVPKENVAEIYNDLLDSKAFEFIKKFPTSVDYDEALMEISDWTGESEDFEPTEEDEIALLKTIGIDFEDENIDINDWDMFFNSLIVTDWYINDEEGEINESSGDLPNYALVIKGEISKLKRGPKGGTIDLGRKFGKDVSQNDIKNMLQEYPDAEVFYQNGRVMLKLKD